MTKSVLPIRGREVELAAVSRRLANLDDGMGATIVVEGRSGMGKSRFLHEVSALAVSRGTRVGLSSAYQGESIVELAALMAALFDGEQALLELSALARLRGSPEQRFWILHDIQSLLEKVAMDHPLLVAIDDVQWADSGTAAALRVLPARLATLPIAWVVASRPDQGSPAVRTAISELRNAGAEVVSLGPIDRAALSEMAGDILKAHPESGIVDAAEQAEGSPFLVVELLRAMQVEQMIDIRDGIARLDDRQLPQRLAISITDRLGRVSDRAGWVATSAASLGPGFSLEELASISDMALGDLIALVGELIDADILTQAGERLRFGHDLVREGVRANATPAIRRALDRKGADVLLMRGALAVELAEQLARSAEPGDDAAIATLLAATEVLGTTDPAAAADLARRTLDLTPARHPTRGALVVRRAISLFAAGQSVEAKDFADRVLRQALPPEQEAQVRTSIAQMFSLSPDMRAENARKGLALLGVSTDARAWLSGLLFHNLIVAGRSDEAYAIEAEVRACVYESTTRAGWYPYEVALAGLAYQEFDFERAIALLDRADSRVIHGVEDGRERLSANFRCWILSCVDRFDEALLLADENIAAAQRDRQNWAIVMNENWKGRQLFQMGRLNEATSILEGRFSRAETPHVAGILDVSSAVALGRIAIHSGDARLMKEISAISEGLVRNGSPMIKWHGAWFLALYEKAKGNPDEGLRWLTEISGSGAAGFLPLFPLETTDEVELVEMAVQADDRKLAELVSGAADDRSIRNPGISSLAAVASHCRGLVEHSVKELSEAVALYESVPRTLWRARACESMGESLLDEGESVKAIEAFDLALVQFTDCGALWDAARARNRLRELGVRRRITNGLRPSSGWGALTNAEQSVAQLATGGYTNREIAERLFISPHTVGTHLRHIFEKLDIDSRVDLTRVAAERNPYPPGDSRQLAADHERSGGIG